MAYIVKTKKCLIYRLNKELKRDRLLDVTSIQRGLGKTRLLVELSKSYKNAFIVQPDLQRVRFFQREFPDINFISAYDLVNNNRYGSRRNEIFLLDEGIKLREEKEIRKRYNVLGGYSQIIKEEKYIKPKENNKDWCLNTIEWF